MYKVPALYMSAVYITHTHHRTYYYSINYYNSNNSDTLNGVSPALHCTGEKVHTN